jgi:hypothetical protein
MLTSLCPSPGRVPIGRFDATPVITVVVSGYDPAISFFVGVWL